MSGSRALCRCDRVGCLEAVAGVRQRIHELSLPPATRDLVVVNSLEDVREPLRGGVDLAEEQLFDVTFPRWFADGRATVAAVHEVPVTT